MHTSKTVPGGVRKATKTGHLSNNRNQQNIGAVQQLCVGAHS